MREEKFLKINAKISKEANDFVDNYKKRNFIKYKEDAIDMALLELKKIKETKQNLVSNEK